jgi:hypothetical protein
MTEKAITSYKKDLKRKAQVMAEAHPAEQTLTVEQFEFAYWLATYPHKRPPVREQQEKLQELTQRKVSPRALRQLKRQKQFIEYYNKIKYEQLERAKARIEQEMVDMVEIHVRSAKELFNDGDFDKVSPLTNPFLDRIWPKTETSKPQTNININLSEAQTAILMNETPVEVDYEVIEEPEKEDAINWDG